MFQALIFAEDVKDCNPDPEGLRLALQAHRCQPRQAMVFEDSVAGFQAAANVSFAFVDLGSLTLYD